ncbi:purine permease [Macrolepiota fuliginosa MF-IS2]|uniref:Purine permease n=1 Tax=Macrolepiota fuliginosa MF-IS2 TaxID=1400762 RepID=A0A9P5X8J7_9AGAR|nr:purine permease [Macrolepiota fuliginosa MF-IS2]
MPAPSVTEQPASMEVPSTKPIMNSQFGNKLDLVKHKVMTREGWLGDYDYGWLCTPTLPFMNKSAKRDPPFYALDDELPLVLAISSGLQHALAMLAGLITPPIIFASTLNLPPDVSAYMISASLIGCGILSLVQISRIHLFKNYYIGTGLITVVGTSFATLSTANAIFNAMYTDGTCPSSVVDGVVVRGPCPDAYGKVLGTSMICSFLEIFMSFCSPRALKRIFPPIVTGTVILLIGASLVGTSGIANWGGGSNDCQARPETGFFALCPNIAAPRPLPWGSAEFIGLGFLSFVSILLTEVFGSPFMKNISVIIGLLIGCIVAAATGYMTSDTINSAPAITFLWVHRFKISVYPSAILPMLAVYVSLTMESIGDITASAEVSRQPVVGEVFDSRIQGGVLSDGISGFVSALFTVTPLSTFAQNNGVIAITRCANRSAGRWCCMFLILFGVLGKISGVFLAIPNPVLGGVTTFLFSSVATSGLRVLAHIKFTRRDRFILGAALSFGIGNLLKPDIFTHLFERVDNPNKGLKGLFDSITIVLSTPFLSAGVIAALLNLILPLESPSDLQSEGPEAGVAEETADVESQPDEKSKVF